MIETTAMKITAPLQVSATSRNELARAISLAMFDTTANTSASFPLIRVIDNQVFLRHELRGHHVPTDANLPENKRAVIFALFCAGLATQDIAVRERVIRGYCQSVSRYIADGLMHWVKGHLRSDLTRVVGLMVDSAISFADKRTAAECVVSMLDLRGNLSASCEATDERQWSKDKSAVIMAIVYSIHATINPFDGNITPMDNVLKVMHNVPFDLTTRVIQSLLNVNDATSNSTPTINT